MTVPGLAHLAEPSEADSTLIFVPARELLERQRRRSGDVSATFAYTLRGRSREAAFLELRELA